MVHRRWATRVMLGVATTTAVLVAGCGTSGSPAPAGSSGPASSSTSAHAGGPAVPTGPAQVQVTDAVGKQLCDDIQPQLSDWRIQGPTLGRAALNIEVHDWAFRNGAINLQVLADKAVIDRLMVKNCPDVRTQALQALELNDLASGIAF
ncbi:hypothetical protein [Nocardia sp. alder85J]|uniref:hypothetical protein n=1 Tax=Nocardia sp. alder85J TaxID=2862949 RepID=UPI001CD4D278|nr:hypothetical protein [Nocardia sp. alder85J]MCX4098643.1 hypothetical protein [Nocardia sp. alder85J]